MSQTTINIITALFGQVTSFGLAAFAWQYFQERNKKIDDQERRLQRLENREEMRKELGVDQPYRPTAPPQQPKKRF